MSLNSSTATTSTVSSSTDVDISALLQLTKWGGAQGTGVTLTYSFPRMASAHAPSLVEIVMEGAR